jgi:hypothetical protein
MPATMATEGGWVQLEQSNMGAVLNIANISKHEFYCATKEER